MPYSPQANSKAKHGILTTRTLARQMKNLQISLVINGKNSRQDFLSEEKRNRCRCDESDEEGLSRLRRSAVGSYWSGNPSNDRIEDRSSRIMERRISMGRNPT